MMEVMRMTDYFNGLCNKMREVTRAREREHLAIKG